MYSSSVLSQEDLERLRQKVLDQIVEVTSRSQHTAKVLCSGREQLADEGDRATVMENDLREVSRQSRDLRHLRKLEATLARIEKGAYGQCESCCGEIGLARLEERPVASVCITCKIAQERLE